VTPRPWRPRLPRSCATVDDKGRIEFVAERLQRKQIGRIRVHREQAPVTTRMPFSVSFALILVRMFLQYSLSRWRNR